ncbi:hypothetical protein [Undibacterium flavidum]|uniref:Uncharacterized protein n=1 Tax=Undibacterium flavidum TaxID=2762297 RepID=A0ABR6YEG6_9BURK|nr:hypothetical protein [Undibacterium flavidum]MBC3874918.1 hypothetical protein [Undibacterium flavidum]
MRLNALKILKSNRLLAPSSLRKFSFLVLVVCTTYGAFAFSSYRLIDAGKQHITAKHVDILIAKALKYLPFSFAIVDRTELDLILAYHILHQKENEYVAMMSNGGVALKMFQDVEEKNHNSFPKYSSISQLQLLNLLVRMPWNENLRRLSDIYSKKVRDNLNARLYDSDDESTAHENLAIYFARINSRKDIDDHAALADSIDLQQFEPTIAEALMFIRYQRIAMGACIFGAGNDVSWSLKINPREAKAVRQHFLRDQYYQAWDMALVKTVILGSKEESCKNLAIRHQSLAGAVN